LAGDPSIEWPAEPAPQALAKSASAELPNGNERQVLLQLIPLLIRRKALSQIEGELLLRMLIGSDDTV
ncbi:MAG: hypothetical protein ACRD5L_15385, partial [Bryobacteraceae bacterium]